MQMEDGYDCHLIVLDEEEHAEREAMKHRAADAR